MSDLKTIPHILMIGTNPESKGGISSVIRLYQQAPFFRQVVYLPSYTDGSVFLKVAFYLGFLMRLFFTLLTMPSIKIVHIHSASYGSFFRKALAFWISRGFCRKTIVHIHGAEFHLFYEKSQPWIKKFIEKTLAAADMVIALSSQWQKKLEAISGKPNVHVLYNPTIVSNLDTDPSPAGCVEFLFMGRLGSRKGVYDLIDSAAMINGSARITLYGDGDVEEVRSYIRRRQVEKKVFIGGWVSGEKKNEILRAADVLVLPSYNEGLPISILEAMAFGKPVISTNVGGIAEAVEDEVNGFLLTPGDYETLARRIKQLSESETLRHKMGKAGYEKACRQFSLPVVEARLWALYEQLLLGSDPGFVSKA